MVIQLVQHDILNFKFSNSKFGLIMTYIPKYFQNGSSVVHILISYFHNYIFFLISFQGHSSHHVGQFFIKIYSKFKK